MKILQINKLYYPWIGGVEKIVQQISEGLNNKDNIEIKVLCCASPKKSRILDFEKGTEEAIGGVKIVRASIIGMVTGLPISFSFFKLFKKLSKDADIINLHHPFTLGDLAIFLFRPKAKIILHYHSDIVRQKIAAFFLKPLIYNTLKKSSKIIISSPNLLKSSPILKKFEEKCEIIPFGVDYKKFQKLNKENVDLIKREYGDFILFIGRLTYYKGLSYLIRAMKDVKNNLLIIGDGKKKKDFELMTKNLGLNNRIHFLPSQPEKNLIDFYNASTALVLPSIFKSEAFGIVLIEAMACGKPIVSTELETGTSFVNQDKITGLVVPPKNIDALSRAINIILEDKKMAEIYGQNARNRVLEHFTIEKMLESVKSIYFSP